MARSPDSPDIPGLSIDRSLEVPITVQLAWSLRARIDDGTLAPGRRLPGLRELADALGVNVNTVRAVYQRIEREGLIESRQGSGTFVSRALAPAGGPASAGRIAAAAARRAHASGVDPREVAAALYVSGRGAEDESARRRRLREQIAALERALGEIEAEYASILPPPATEIAGRGPALLSADELERTRSGLMRRLAEVQSAIERRSSQPKPRAAPRARPRAGQAPSRAPADKPRPGARATPRPAPAGT
jgi:DNA-binding transcriptional regulator YhcF (GntR family)